MICTCEKCRYTISAQSLPLSCPDCGSEAVRPATQMEQDWYYDLQQEKCWNPDLLDKKKKKKSIPHEISTGR